MDWDSLALVGRVARPHGLRGHVFVNAETDFPEQRFATGAEVFVRRAGEVVGLRITSVRFQRGRPVIGLAGIDTIEAAGALVNAELRVPIASLAALPTGAYYRHDLVGCRVERLDGTPVGVVADVEVAAGISRLVIDLGGASALVPLAQDICPVVDPVGKRIVIDPPSGLLEVNARP